MNHLALQPRLLPRPPVVRRNERERLLAALAVTKPERWPLTWRHMADKLFEHDAGRLPKLFPDE